MTFDVNLVVMKDNDRNIIDLNIRELRILKRLLEHGAIKVDQIGDILFSTEPYLGSMSSSCVMSIAKGLRVKLLKHPSIVLKLKDGVLSYSER